MLWFLTFINAAEENQSKSKGVVDLLKLPQVVILSLVLTVSQYGDMGNYSMIGDWVVHTVSTYLKFKAFIKMTAYD